MKKIAILLLLGSLCFASHAWEPSYNSDELVWFGMDYTLVQFIGSSDQFSDLSKIRTHYFRSWNELIMNEESKYDLRPAFSVDKISYEIENTILRSEQREMDGIVQTGSYSIDEGQVKSVVMLNTNPAVNKVGAIFVMETLNKMEEETTMWLAVFEVATGTILYMKRYSGEVSGFGFRNYWARSYYNVISNLRVSPRKDG
ncbi:MAG: hypothetical protein GY790_07920 [Bacteroidetes bacterium]|nr:hypothetical protein [Bacteroidota bacterium]